MTSNPYILLNEKSWKNYLISSLSPFLQILNYNFIAYAYFTYAAVLIQLTEIETEIAK